MGIFNRLFGKKEKAPQFSQEQWDRCYQEKQAGLERILGKMHTMVGHAIIPFNVGGAVDMYYFTDGIPGTAFATMELIKPDGSGSVPNRLGTYELITFTRERYNPAEGEEVSDFDKMERRMCGIMTSVGAYSFQAKLEPNETMEAPGEEGEPNICLLLDDYRPDGVEFIISERKHGLLLVIEVFREEMEWARANGGGKLIEKLKKAGHYPYSDLNRQSVLK